VFLAGLALASRAEHNFMARDDWTTWPSGLALGPHGWAWAASSLALGALLSWFGASVFRSGVSRAGGTLLVIAAMGAALFAFSPDLKTVGDHVETANPFNAETTRGMAHAIGFMGLFLPALLVGEFVLWRRLRRLPRWQESRRSSALVLLLVVPALLLPAGRPIGGYVVLALLMSPSMAMAARLAYLAEPAKDG
jgi:hypothetical protein